MKVLYVPCHVIFFDHFFLSFLFFLSRFVAALSPFLQAFGRWGKMCKNCEMCIAKQGRFREAGRHRFRTRWQFCHRFPRTTLKIITILIITINNNTPTIIFISTNPLIPKVSNLGHLFLRLLKSLYRGNRCSSFVAH